MATLSHERNNARRRRIDAHQRARREEAIASQDRLYTLAQAKYRNLARLHAPHSDFARAMLDREHISAADARTLDQIEMRTPRLQAEKPAPAAKNTKAQKSTVGKCVNCGRNIMHYHDHTDSRHHADCHKAIRQLNANKR